MTRAPLLLGLHLGAVVARDVTSISCASARVGTKCCQDGLNVVPSAYFTGYQGDTCHCAENLCHCAKDGEGMGCAVQADSECRAELDISQGYRPEGVECDGGKGRCLKITRGGVAPLSVECVGPKWHLCRGAVNGKTCSFSGFTRFSAACYVPTDGSQSPMCAYSRDIACMNKAAGAQCVYKKYARIAEMETSKCSDTKCLDASDGVCMGKSEGDACDPYTVIEFISAKVKRYEQVSYTGGTCMGAKAAERRCVDATEASRTRLDMESGSKVRSAVTTLSMFCALLGFMHEL